MPGGSIQVTDGTHTVSSATELDFTSGATVTDGGGGVAQVAISGGGGITLGSYAFTYNTASLNAGVNTGITAASGKVMIFAWVTITTPWNGTTPLADFGVGVSGGGSGVLGGIASNFPMTSSAATPSGGATTPTLSSFTPAVWNTSGQIQLWVSRDATKGGTSPGASQGAATFYILQTS